MTTPNRYRALTPAALSQVVADYIARAGYPTSGERRLEFIGPGASVDMRDWLFPTCKYGDPDDREPFRIVLDVVAVIGEGRELPPPDELHAVAEECRAALKADGR